MSMWLRQSTATTVKLGPFVDETDGKTAETALTISQADIRLSKNGGAYAQTNNSAGATHDEAGEYGIPLDTTDTNTLGRLKVRVSESGALPVWQTFMVVPANVWDSLFGADQLQVHVNEMTAGIITAAVIATDAIDADAIADNAINAGAIAADALTAAKFAADVTTELQSGLATAASIAALNNLSAAQVNSEVDTALADVGLTTTITGRIDAAITTRASQASVNTIDDLLDSEIPALTTAVDALPTLAEILAGVVEGAITIKGALRLMLAVLAGESTGGGTTTVTFRDVADAKARVTATVTEDGNRTAITRDITD